MDWWKPPAVLTLAVVAFVAVGGLAGLVAGAVGNPTVLAVSALVVVAVAAASAWGSAPPDRLSTPYWGR